MEWCLHCLEDVQRNIVKEFSNIPAVQAGIVRGAGMHE